MEPGETVAATVVRELREETGLTVSAHDLIDLGVHRYLKNKDLALMAWVLSQMPDPKSLSCASTFMVSGGVLPEFDQFGIFLWDEALGRVGKNLARVLDTLRHRDGRVGRQSLIFRE